MRPTVHDIAERAGVSLATVDRVLNRRPGVREETRERVEAAIEALGYVRDMAAANLAKGRVYPLIFILPSSDNSFMHGLHDALAHAAGRSASERTDIRIVEVPPFDPPALIDALMTAHESRPAGIALVAVEDEGVRAAIDTIAADGIPVVTLVSDLPGSRRVHYAGVDNIAAGRTAGSLLGRFLNGRTGAIGVLAGSMLVRDHRERLDGFSAVIAAEYPQLSVLPVREGRDDPDLARAAVAGLLAEQPDLIGIYSLGAGNRGLIAALKAGTQASRPAVIVHELTAYSRAALTDGLIDAVLNQDAGHEIRSAIRVLKAKADGMPVIAAQERIRIDIFLKDNLP